jgi:alanyl-tRNA synthetase
VSWSANRLRNAFTAFFVERGHSALPPALLIPNDPSVLFTIAGMVQFKPYFTGEAVPPVRRATTIQPCFRTVDIDVIGTTARHNTFFEMLGNFSFGDYFKELAIPYAWQLVTEVLGFDPGQLWITVHDSDDEAEQIWRDAAAVAPERIQRMGADNFWQMGATGPCGPCSEIYFDKGDRFGDGGGPASGGDERYVEIWNLVFMQYDRQADTTLVPLPRPNIDTGAGLERILALLEGVDSIFETSVIAPVVDEAASLTGQAPGSSHDADVALRILADHARAMAFLVSDGVFPSNEGRGYVLRRVVRRAVLRAHQLGVGDLVTPALVGAVVETMRAGYPKLERDRAIVEKVVAREEEAFRRTLRAGSALLEEELARGLPTISGEVAFRLHDTYGFPIELTTEIAEGRGVRVDLAGFEAAMGEQRLRARQGGRGRTAIADQARDAYRDALEEFGPTEFLGYRELSSDARVLAVLGHPEGGDFENIDGERPPEGAELLDVVLDRTPFYSESGGQVGDTGTIEGPTGSFRVLDTTVAVEGLTRHTGYLLAGELEPGATVTATVDAARRDDIRRNHTGTHLLHWALRQVLGDHVKQQGSLVAPRRLRFDFHHFAPMSEEEVAAVEDLVNTAVIADEPVRITEMERAAAESAGAVAFFGEKYGERVRVVEAGSRSVELCGGTHVHALGMIGPLRIVGESSIGANTRRIEATTGQRSLEEIRAAERTLAHAAASLRTVPAEVPAAAQRLITRERELEEELRRVRLAQLATEAAELAARAGAGRVVVRRDGLDQASLRELALKVRDHDGVEAVALVGSPDGQRVALVVAARPGSGVDARSVAAAAGSAIGGGGGGSPELATAGGRSAAGIEDAVAALRQALTPPPGRAGA